MHDGAYQRMREFVEEWVNDIEVSNGSLTADSFFGLSTRAVTAFVA